MRCLEMWVAVGEHNNGIGYGVETMRSKGLRGAISEELDRWRIGSQRSWIPRVLRVGRGKEFYGESGLSGETCRVRFQTV